ncbi:hypothetical protein BCR44DRAFT_40976 [Catenaria anguillulae PL171]|uniref:Uncharacterized protein n=1 Tax=Catenaria anguillulae PL171 TaxID=765915 RepID=A0A1Y2HKB0_9FUNG|nr:hypothetical protein BCR44DRAFT_40976 [Catenaria anguillulae PL171]
MLYTTSTLIFLLALLGSSKTTLAAPTPFAPAAISALTVTIKNSNGPGTLQLTFTEKPASAFPSSFFTVLGGAPTPQSVVQFKAKAKGFPTDQKFNFHIHEAAVDNGNCSSTKDHWDPLQAHPKFRGGKKEDYKPVAGNWSTYELGDLSGKYGAINAPANATLALPNYVERKREAAEQEEELLVVDPTLTTLAAFAKLSVVVHDGAGARVGCANFEVVVDKDEGGDNLAEPGYGKKKHKNKCTGKKKAGGY